LSLLIVNISVIRHGAVLLQYMHAMDRRSELACKIPHLCLFDVVL